MISLFYEIYRSPLRTPEIFFYFGRKSYGHPYFLPRKTIKQDGKYIFKPIKYFGFDSNGLGWKEKFDRLVFEWEPSFSIIFFGFQFHVKLTSPKDIKIEDCYWEAWLYYKYRTDLNNQKEARLFGVFSQYSCTWTSQAWENLGGKKDFYPLILKKKYLNLYVKWKYRKTQQDSE